MTVRAICDVIGVEPGEEGGEYGRFLPPVVQVNVAAGSVGLGEAIIVPVRVVVRQLVAAPILGGET